MINIAEAPGSTTEGWVIEVMPNKGHPVTHWLVVGPYYTSGSETDREGAFDGMFDDGEAALAYARGVADDWPYSVRVVVYPPDPPV